MKIFNNFLDITSNDKPVILTIGYFDGFHLGHQRVIEMICQRALQENAPATVFTFSNHPSSVLNPQHPVPRLCTTAHKVNLLEKAGISQLFLLPFTKDLSEQTAEQFFEKLIERLTIRCLILGNDAHVGKNRGGDQNKVLEIAKSLNFEVKYLPDLLIDHERISSTRLRNDLNQGDLKSVEKLLGRPYSIFSSVIKGALKGRALGFPTANINVDNLCLPPLGVYSVSLSYQGMLYPGIANLGIAPTMRSDGKPLLEVHLFNCDIDLYDQTVEVHFHSFLRSEKRFDTVEELKKQIKKDIELLIPPKVT